jgi:hypothetical protein
VTEERLLHRAMAKTGFAQATCGRWERDLKTASQDKVSSYCQVSGENRRQSRLAESLEVKSEGSFLLRTSEKSGLAVDCEERQSTDLRGQSPMQVPGSQT